MRVCEKDAWVGAGSKKWARQRCCGKKFCASTILQRPPQKSRFHAWVRLARKTAGIIT